MVSRPTYAQWMSVCKDGNSSSSACASARNGMRTEVGNNIDPYAIDYPVCKEFSKYDEIYLHYKYIFENIDNSIEPPGIYGKMLKYFNKYPNEIYYYDNNIERDNSNIDEPKIILTIDGFPYDPCESRYLHVKQ